MVGILVLVGAGLLIIILISYGMTVYNGLITVKNNIDKSWANIDVLLKQRHDEIPKLLKTCEGYMQYERSTLEKIVALRSAAQSAQGVGDKAKAEGNLSLGLSKIFALAENYPELKAQSSFQQLQSRISDLENQIADRREFYNDSVNNYNIRIESMPDAFVARALGLSHRDMFKVADTDREDVDIKFNMPA